MKEQYLECGRITSTHGVRGAVIALRREDAGGVQIEML